MRTRKSLLAAIPLLLALASPGWSQLILDPVADGTLYEDAFGEYANGSGENAFVGDNSSGEVRRGVFRFDLSQAPPGQRVSRATLEFSVTQVSPSGPSQRQMDIHRLTSAWSVAGSDAGLPGGSGTDPEPGDATWIHRSYPNVFWTNAGGDFSPTATASVFISSPIRYEISTVALRAEVQDWIDNPSQNHGWLFKMNDEASNSAVRIPTGETQNPSVQPRLILEFNTFTSFCDPADINSTGASTLLIGGLGFGVGSGFHLEVFQGPPNQIGYVLVGTGSAQPGIPLGSGHLCLAATPSDFLGRYNVGGTPHNSVGIFNATGQLINMVGTSTTGTGYDVPTTVPIPGNPTIMAGDLWHFQVWHRENNGNSNLSNGLSVQF